MSSQLDLSDHEEELACAEGGGASLPFVLQTLRPKHKQALALLAQGYKNTEVAAMVGYTKDYVSALLRQPLCIDFIRGMNEAVALQLEAQFGQVAGVISDAFAQGNTGEKLKAARLHLEVTKRIGSGRESAPSGQSSEERLASLAHRLIDLLPGAQHGRVIQGEATSVQGEAGIQWDALRGQGEGEQEGVGETREGG